MKLLSVSTILFLLLSGMSGAVSLESEYLISGKTEYGDYYGNLEINSYGEGYEVYWEISSGEVYYGIGFAQQDYLAVAYCDEGYSTIGIVLYKVGETILNGVWAAPGEPPVIGTEVAYTGEEPEVTLLAVSTQPDLSGSYQVEGNNPDGSEYLAVVVLKDYYGLYLVEFCLDDYSIFGFGLCHQDQFLVGWYEQEQMVFGVSLLEIEDEENLSGPWILYGNDGLGYEYWTKQ